MSHCRCSNFVLLTAFLALGPGGTPARSTPLSLWSLYTSRSPFGAAPFTVTDLGTLGGGSSTANSVNDLAQVAGSSLTASGVEHAFLFSDGKLMDLGTLSDTS